MSKYRQLSQEELKGMEEEFIRFLAVNGITNDLWADMKTNNVEGVTSIMGEFSDMVWSTILRKTKYVDLYERQSIATYYCDKELLYMRGMMTQDDNYDFTTAESIALSRSSPPKDLETFTSKRHYQKSREDDIYELLKRGGQITDGSIYQALNPNK